MVIGQHYLEGSVVTLKSPFLLIDEPEDESGQAPAPDVDKQLEIKGVVKKKIIFKTRPKPVGMKRPREST